METIPVTNPATGEVISNVKINTAEDLNMAVKTAASAQKGWAETPLKDRVQVFFALKQLMERDMKQLANLIRDENGKTIDEAVGSISRGIECIEYATSLPQVMAGEVLEVGRGIECKSVRTPIGVVAGITPFNFPLMVPLWMAPLALSCGNAFILKPSEQTPLSAFELARLLSEAGLPKDLFQVMNGGPEIVNAICDHQGIAAVGFVGSSKVAKLVHERGTKSGKRVRALGGAKNHLVLVPDADPELAASNIMASVTGCAGQRCMAASVLLAVGDVDHIIAKVVEKMKAIVPGQDMGPVISEIALQRISGYIERAPDVLLDGRKSQTVGDPRGNFIGASVIDNAKPSAEAACDEIFGPVLTIIRCKTLDEALAIENANPYGNAAAIYTSSGRVAQYFTEHASAGMIGINIGVPVPREPFPFGGWNQSAFGDGDITGPSAIDFWTRNKKITTKWSAPKSGANWMS
jgi:malonate-semialdehyde dehydrogenase (acetylating)/methylmalonate-semialdehyde dehydrogenase